MQLTGSQSHYIMAVYELSFGCSEGVRVCKVAEKLNVSKASASLALTKLSEQGLMYKDADRRAHLTEIGERKAIQLMDKFDIISMFFVKILGVEKSVAYCDACAIEHVISMDTICALCRYTKKCGQMHLCKENVIYLRMFEYI